MNSKFQEIVHKLAAESGIVDKAAAEKFAAALGARWLGINTPFICGGSEEKDSWGLPKTLLICPAYGADGMCVYEKKGEYSAPGY